MIIITVTTSDGAVYPHEYENTPAVSAELDSIFAQCMDIIAGGAGSFLLANPMAIYNVNYVIRISRTDSG